MSTYGEANNRTPITDRLRAVVDNTVAVGPNAQVESTIRRLDRNAAVADRLRAVVDNTVAAAPFAATNS